MASKAFKAALANLKTNKNIETVLVGSSYLGEGTHDVTIKTVDSTKMDDGKLLVTYVSADGKEFTDSPFLTSQDGTEFGYGVRALWSATIPGKDALEKFMDIIETDDKAFEMLTGMKLRITLEPGKGVQGRANGDGTFAGYDVESGDKVTESYASLREVYDYLKANAIKRSYMRIVRSEATAKDENIAAFERAVAAKNKAANSGAQFSVAV